MSRGYMNNVLSYEDQKTWESSSKAKCMKA